MKLRTGILFVCMLVVPLLAMFSHKIPKPLRDEVRRHVWQPLARSAATPTAVGIPSPPEASTVTHSSAGPSAGEPSSSESPPHPAIAGPQAPPATDAVTVLPEVPLRSTLVPPPGSGPVDRIGTSTGSTAPAIDVESARRRLATLGAVGLQVKQADAVPTAAGVIHVASCRVPVDASGRLQRLFQASAPTAEESIARLTEQVAAWKSRLAGQPDPSISPARLR